MSETRPEVFISAPAIVTSEQRGVLFRWIKVLAVQGLDIVSLERRSYAQSPWEQLRGLMAQVDGVLVLGLPQLELTMATWRPGTDEETSVSGYWASPWMHLEAGMAIAAQLPLLVVSAKGVTEGVFSSKIWSGDVLGVDADATDSSTIGDFAVEVLAHAVRRRGAEGRESGSGR
jgi:hypothetical protein